MEKQDSKLEHLFKQMGDKHTEKLKMPDLRLRDAVFSTVDATTLMADILELFTVQFLKTQAEVIDVLPESPYSVMNEKEKLFNYHLKKRAENKLSDKDNDSEDIKTE